MTSIQQRLSTGRGKFTTDYPELGTAPGQLRRLDLRGILRRRTQGGVRTKLVVRRAYRAVAAQGFVLHPRPARAPRLDRDRPRPERHRARIPQRVRPPRQQGRLAGTSRQGKLGKLSRILVQVPRLAVRPGRQGQPRHQRRRVLRPRQEHAADAAGALRGLGGLHLRQPRRRTRCRCAVSSATGCCPSRTTRSI